MRKPNTICATCNIPIYRKPNEISNSKSGKNYCSQNCYGKDNRLSTLCPICNTNRLKSSSSKTCSRRCSNISRRGSKYIGRPLKDNAKDLRSIRLRLFKERGAHCDICDLSNSNILQVHHIIEKSRGGTDEDNNLQILCPNCHYTIHLGDSRISED